MAEAHSAVAFTFSVTPDGVNYNLNHEALKAVWHSGVVSWKKRVGRMKNTFKNGIFPAAPVSWFFLVSLILALKLGGYDPSYGCIDFIQNHVPGLSSASTAVSLYGSCIVFSIVTWMAFVFLIRYSLKLVLSYHGWMYEVRGPMSLKTKLWMVLVRVFGGRRPLLMSYQASLPKLPVPSLTSTVDSYLESVRPLMDDEKYEEMVKLARDFEKGLGRKLQRYLVLKSWWATNYVSDWWEEYVYLRGRSPIMVNSNFYGVDCILLSPSTVPTARAGNIVYFMLQYRSEIDREELQPLLVNKTVPLCSSQYERQFNTTRIPGIETDKLVHYRDSNHIAVYHKGKYFKVYIRQKGRLLKPCELEIIFQKILDDSTDPAPGEEHLAALTAGNRVPWAKARTEFFSKGKNKASLDAIEKAAFVLTFDTEPQEYDRNDTSKLDKFGRAMLHGKGYDRWFDKSFTLVICSNGRIGFNAEHSWADAPIMAHLWEIATVEDRRIGYKPDGHCKGEPVSAPLNPIRLEWDLPNPCLEVIANSLEVAKQLLNDVDLHLFKHDVYGKGFIKTCKVSPDAFIQMALQLAYFRDGGKFCLTYESSMTRLFREGRTETVRSCSVESCAFVQSIENKEQKKESIRLLRVACDAHQKAYRDTMTGRGCDRHLFCLYVVSKYLGEDSPFLSDLLSEPWRLSTSQTPHQQTNLIDLKKNPDYISGGGGFGPVADDGYGVSYIVAGEDNIFFHVSSKISCPKTNSVRFAQTIGRAMSDMRDLFQEV